MVSPPPPGGTCGCTPGGQEASSQLPSFWPRNGAERPSTGQLLVRSTSPPPEALRGLGCPLSKEPLSRIRGNLVVLSPEPRAGSEHTGRTLLMGLLPARPREPGLSLGGRSAGPLLGPSPAQPAPRPHLHIMGTVSERLSAGGGC